jgi:ribonuclease HII
MGVDDAGRGPLIGPMILAGVLIDKNSEAFLKKQDVKDSKMLTHSVRVRLAKMIREASLSYKVVKTYPREIDKALTSKINLNTLEAMKIAEVINGLNDGKQKIRVVIDCPSVNIKAWHSTLLSHVENQKNLQIACEHKADVNHIAVASASILAKVAREEEVAKIKKQYGNIGSGYPSDPDTKEFLKKQGKKLSDSGIFRKSWQTWKRLHPEKNQATLGDF